MTVKSMKEILEGPKISNYKNSEKNRDMVASQIEKIWGKSELKNYSPEKSALPYSKWISLGWKPKRGSRALKSTTIIEKKDALGNVIERYPRRINLFYYRSVEPIVSNKSV